jgi:peptide/nickel transport system permease protein
MVAYLLRRVVQAIIVVFAVSIIVFILLHLLPGGPARAILGPRAIKPRILAFDREYGLLKPLPVQYLIWVTQLLHGNLGFSYKQDQSVASLLEQSAPRTIALAGTATFLALLIAVPLGLYEAVRRNHVDDYVLTGLSFLFYAMPAFFLGMVLIILFSISLPWLPSLGPNPAVPLWTQLPNMVLPIATLCLVTIALFSRYMRSATMDVIVQDYVRTARAKGVSNPQVLIRHVLGNALIPIITLVGMSLPWILSGALVVEALFNYPGMGYLFWQALATDDFPVTLGIVLVVGVMVVLGSLLADILYAVLDPRVRYTSR